MPDCILIQGGRAHAVYPGATKAALCFKVHDGDPIPPGHDAPLPRPIFPPATVNAIVEVESGSVVVGQVWNGTSFDPLPVPPTPRRRVPKSVIVARLHAAGKLEAARAALDAQPLIVRERWNAAAAIYADDETALALFAAIGADAAAIMAAGEA